MLSPLRKHICETLRTYRQGSCPLWNTTRPYYKLKITFGVLSKIYIAHEYFATYVELEGNDKENPTCVILIALLPSRYIKRSHAMHK